MYVCLPDEQKFRINDLEGEHFFGLKLRSSCLIFMCIVKYCVCMSAFAKCKISGYTDLCTFFYNFTTFYSTGHISTTRMAKIEIPKKLTNPGTSQI